VTECAVGLTPGDEYLVYASSGAQSLDHGIAALYIFIVQLVVIGHDILEWV
jgi:hypothetical protein